MFSRKFPGHEDAASLVMQVFSMNQDKIRNFTIIAHIDHGKSTLADRFIDLCQAVAPRHTQAQVLDDMDIERERGITIKARAVRLPYRAANGEAYEFNLIDTPGHVDFAYEVSRALAACEGSILLVDASQGVEAQTLANAYLAIEHDHIIIPVLNKVDLPQADPDRVANEIEEVIGLDAADVISVSAKTGLNVEAVLAAVVERIPPPSGNPDAPLRALIADSWYDPYRGVMALVRVRDGAIKRGMKVRFMATKADAEVDLLAVSLPKEHKVDGLSCGEVGLLGSQIKTVDEAKVGDTITETGNQATEALPGFRTVQPVVFSGIYPADSNDLSDLREALEKLQLNDSSIVFETESSAALGMGFRCGFLGLLHLEIILERLEREFNLDLVGTAPSVVYRVHLTDGEVQEVHNPNDYPEAQRIDHVEEPWIRVTVLCPSDYLGGVLELLNERRGEQVYLTWAGDRAMAVYGLPLNEAVFDFHDRLKSVSRGYASFDYVFDTFRPANLVKVTILVNGDSVDALAMMLHRTRAEQRGRQVITRLKDLIPRQLFKVALQATIGGKIIARETITAMRKDVTAKCYGGDITRKRKLLEKQKAGKKRMRQMGRIDVPQNVFLEALRGDGK